MSDDTTDVDEVTEAACILMEMAVKVSLELDRTTTN